MRTELEIRSKIAIVVGQRDTLLKEMREILKQKSAQQTRHEEEHSPVDTNKAMKELTDAVGDLAGSSKDNAQITPLIGTMTMYSGILSGLYYALGYDKEEIISLADEYFELPSN